MVHKYGERRARSSDHKRPRNHSCDVVDYRGQCCVSRAFCIVVSEEIPKDENECSSHCRHRNESDSFELKIAPCESRTHAHSLTIHALDRHLHRIKPLARRNKKRLPVFAAEADVGGPGFGDVYVFDLLAGGIKDGDAFAGEIDVAVAVNGHAVGAEFAVEFLLGEQAVGLDGVTIGLAGANVGDVEELAVGLLEIVNDADEVFLGGGQVIDALGDFLWPAIPVRPFVVRVGEVKTAGGANPNVVGAVEQFALIVFDDNGDFARRADAPKLVLLIGASPEVAFAIERKTVRPPTRLHERRKFPINTPFEDSIGGLVGEKDIPLGVAGGPFGEGEAASELLERGARRDDLAVGSVGCG